MEAAVSEIQRRGCRPCSTRPGRSLLRRSSPSRPTRSPASTPRRRPTPSPSGRPRPSGYLGHPVDRGPRVEPALRQVVRRRQAQRGGQCVDRHVAAGLGDGSPSTGRASRATPGPSPTTTSSPGEPGRQRPDGARRAGGGQGRHLHADDPRDGGRHVGLRPPGRTPHGCLRGVLRRRAAGRILDCDAHFVITADGGYRRGAAAALKPAVDEAVEGCPSSPCAGRAADRPGRGVGRHP